MLALNQTRDANTSLGSGCLASLASNNMLAKYSLRCGRHSTLFSTFTADKEVLTYFALHIINSIGQRGVYTFIHEGK